jgi:hypothetical protein
VPQVVVADAVDARTLASLTPLVTERLPVDRLAVPVQHEPVMAAADVRPELLEHPRRCRNGAASRIASA